MTRLSRRAGCAAILIVGLAGCAGPASDSRSAATAPTSAVTQPCAPIDISAIRADTGNRVSLARASAAIRAAAVSMDDLSFVARVTPGELVAAGITPPLTATADTAVVLVVSHGDWDSDQLPISKPGSAQVAGSSGAPTPPAPHIAWILTLFPTATAEASDVTYAPDDACFTS